MEKNQKHNIDNSYSILAFSKVVRERHLADPGERLKAATESSLRVSTQLGIKRFKKQHKVGTRLTETALPTERFHGVKGSAMICCGQKSTG